MKSNNLLFALLLISISFTACKKEEENAPNNGNTSLEQYYYYPLTGFVIDTLTGTAVLNVNICQSSALNYGESYLLRKTDNAGYYSGNYTWGGDIRYVHQPNDSANIYICAYTNNQFGRAKVKFGQLSQGHTYSMPTIYLKPVGYLKAHIKDVSGFGASHIRCEGSSTIIQPITIMSSLFFSSTHAAGYVFDTTVVYKTCPGLEAFLTISYGNTVLDHTLSSTPVAISSNDTVSVNMFY